MRFPLLHKEINDVFRSRTALIYFFILLPIITYSFFSAVDLYSKASVAAVDNPLYASGFEPVPGVFVPTFGGLFIIFSLIAPFILIRSISNEKSNNTIPMLFQLPFSAGRLFFAKVLAAMSLIVVSILLFVPLLFFWNFLGGHIPLNEILLLMLGYFLYGFFIISVSLFSSSMFKTASQASIFTLAVIMFPWFIDFGKEMNIIPLLNTFSDLTTTKQLKVFENGVLSIGSVIFFLLLSLVFLTLSFIFFNIDIRKKVKSSIVIIIFFSVLSFFSGNIKMNVDISESRKNSFSITETEFLKKLPAIGIKIFLEPIDGRFKDYENDFLGKLRMVKNDVEIDFAKGENLKTKYGLFKYSLNGKSEETYSNSAHEIFMVLEDLSGMKVKETDCEMKFAGYPLVVKNSWSKYLIILYLILFPLGILFLYYGKNIFVRRKKV